MNRDGINFDDAKTKIQSQWPLEDKLNLADVVIDNSGGFGDWAKQVSSLLKPI